MIFPSLEPALFAASQSLFAAASNEAAKGLTGSIGRRPGSRERRVAYQEMHVRAMRARLRIDNLLAVHHARLKPYDLITTFTSYPTAVRGPRPCDHRPCGRFRFLAFGPGVSSCVRRPRRRRSPGITRRPACRHRPRLAPSTSAAEGTPTIPSRHRTLHRSAGRVRPVDHSRRGATAARPQGGASTNRGLVSDGGRTVAPLGSAWSHDCPSG